MYVDALLSVCLSDYGTNPQRVYECRNDTLFIDYCQYWANVVLLSYEVDSSRSKTHIRNDIL